MNVLAEDSNLHPHPILCANLPRGKIEKNKLFFVLFNGDLIILTVFFILFFLSPCWAG